MEFITVQGTKIPALGYGTWKLAGDECVTGVQKALAHGYRHIDTAQIYENEEPVGTAIKNSAVPRADIHLTTKVWMDKVSDGFMQASVEASLEKLKTDYVDLLLIHWPVNDVPFDEQLKALEDIKKRGLAKLIGVSNFTVAQMKQVVEEIGAPIANNQVEYHPYLSQKPVLDYARAHDMFITAYSPIARGHVMEDETLKMIADNHGKSITQITLRWLIQHGDVAAIPKAAKEEHLQSNFDIFDFKLSAEDMEKIHALARPDGRMIDPDWAPAWDKAA